MQFARADVHPVRSDAARETERLACRSSSGDDLADHPAILCLNMAEPPRTGEICHVHAKKFEEFRVAVHQLAGLTEHKNRHRDRLREAGKRQPRKRRARAAYRYPVVFLF